MTEKKDDRNLDPERVEQNVDNESSGGQDANAGGNDSDYDGGHPSDSESHDKHGEEYARRQHGKDEIDTASFNQGGNDSDYDGGHPSDSTGSSIGKIDSDNN